MTLPKIRFISATSNAAAPLTCGQAFKQGDVPAGSQVVGMQCVPKTTWPDGSLKLAAMSAVAAIVGGTPLDIQLSIGTPAGGTALTTADLKATGITASIDCGSFGTSSWATTDWDSPFQTHTSGPVMSCWFYRKPVGTDSHLVAWLRVRLWSNGAVEVLPWIENGYMFISGPTNKSATYTFTLGGTQRFSMTIDAKHHQRTPLINGAALSYWLGSDPGISVSHDKDYLQSTELVPTYRTRRSATGLTNLPSTWSPFDKGGLIYKDNGYGADRMSNPGYQPCIGIIGEHDAAYLFCNDQPELLWGAVIRNAFAAGRYPIHYRDETTNRPPVLLTYQELTVNNPAVNGLGAGNQSTPAPSGGETTTWDSAHHLSCGYLAYLLTADPYHLETLQLINAGNFYTINCLNNRAGGQRGRFIPDYESVQTRQAAWGMRTLAQAAAVVPDADTAQKASVVAVLNSLIDYYHGTFVAQANNPFGVIEPGESNYGPTLKSGYTGGMMLSPWQDSFFTMSWGFALAAGLPLDSTRHNKLSAFFQWKAKLVVGLMGASSGFRFEHFDIYVVNVSTASIPDFQGGTGPWLADFSAMYAASVAFETSRGQTWFSPLVANTIAGEYDATVWPTSVLGDHMPAIAYAQRFAVPGAAAAFARIANATNWPTIQSNFAAAPVWDVIASSSTPDAGTTPVTTPGPTAIFDTVPLWGANTAIFDPHQGLGVPLNEIPVAGTNALSPIRALVDGTEDPKSEARLRHISNPPGFLAGGDTSYSSPQGAVNYEAYLDGGSLGQATDTLASGGSQSTITGVVVTPASATIAGGGSVQFGWVVNGANNPSQGATLSTDLGTIDPNGTAHAPAATGVDQHGTVTVRSTQDPSKFGTATFTVLAAGSQPGTNLRTVRVQLGGASGAVRNASNLSVSFYDEARPHLTTVAKYQSGTQTTDGSGIMTFSFQSALPIGGVGFLTVYGSDGTHYDQPCAVQ